jgi:charged multivesicular body protein 6
MRRLFGRSTSSTMDVSKSIEETQNQIQLLMKEAKGIENQIQRCIETIKKYKDTNREQAMVALKQKKIYDKELITTNNHISTLLVSISGVRNAQRTHSITKVMEKNNAVIKTLSGKTNVTNIKAVVDDLHDNLEETNESMSILSENFMGDMDDDELELELDKYDDSHLEVSAQLDSLSLETREKMANPEPVASFTAIQYKQQTQVSETSNANTNRNLPKSDNKKRTVINISELDLLDM